MRIFLVRHGEADAEVPEGLGDEARALTAKARQAMLSHFGSLRERIGQIDLVLTSPLVRTVQTAQLLSIAVDHEGSLKAHRSLLPDMPVGSIDPVLSEHAGQSVALVGHQPSMGAIAAFLLGMQSAFPKPVNPGTVIGIERDDEGDSNKARLLFYAPPGQSVLQAID